LGAMNWKRPNATKGTLNHKETSFSTEIFADAVISMVQYLAPLRYVMFCGVCHMFQTLLPHRGISTMMAASCHGESVQIDNSRGNLGTHVGKCIKATKQCPVVTLQAMVGTTYCGQHSIHAMPWL
jgi:hypothetical protein